MSSSRQKSCDACVRSKRRCEQGFPKCRRCIARKIDCEYVGRAAGRLLQDTGSNVDFGPGLDEPVATGAVHDTSSQLQLSPVTGVDPFSPRMGNAFFDLGVDPFNLPSLPAGHHIGPDMFEDLMSQQDPVDAEHITSGAVYQARVEFAAKRLAAAPNTFAQRAQNMFIHRRLFQEKRPPALQDALSACALYCLKTPENQALVLANVQHRSKQLLAGTDPFRVSRTDLLAALQALVLYQIIRLFDGDIRLRAQAEADEPVLATWTKQLKERMHHLVPSLPASAGALRPTQTQGQGWQRWLIEESTRRTVVTSVMLSGVYEFLKLGYDTMSDQRLNFTAQAALWEAQSEIGWRTARSEREELAVRIAHWNDDMLKARPDDVEELGAVTMAMMWGLESTGAWLGKSRLARFGLEEEQQQHIAGELAAESGNMTS